MIRVALLSFWHFHAFGYAEQAQAHPGLDLVAAWDHDPDRGRAGAARIGVPFVEDLEAILTDSSIQAVIVQTPTRDHRAIISRAAAAGKHILTDKVLAATIHDANAIVRAADDAGVVLTTGMPHLNHDYIRRIKEYIDSGRLGRIVNVRMMNCHGGLLEGVLSDEFVNAEEAQGGALIDMCHIVYLTPHLLGGLPDSVYASFGYFAGLEVEDSAVAVLEYSSGTHVSLEASFVTRGAPRFTVEVNGTEGSIIFTAASHPTQTGAPADYRLVARSADDPEFEDVALPAIASTPIEMWVDHVTAGTRHSDNIDRALDLSFITEAAYLSAAAGHPIRLDTLMR